MTIYYCENCREYFELPRITHEVSGSFSVCPYCGSDEYDEAARCKCCDERKPSYEVSDGLCKGCRESFALEFWLYVKDTAAKGYGIDEDTALDFIVEEIEKH